MHNFPEWEICSFHIVSLLDMLIFYAHRFVEVSMRLATMAQVSETENEQIPYDEEIYKELMDDVNWLYERLIEMGLNISAKSILTLREHIRATPHVDPYLCRMINEVGNRIRDELEERLVFIIKPDMAKYFNPTQLIFGSEVSNKFPRWVEDITEAGNCYALGRYTASVFHLMRVMESSVQKFAKKLNLKLKAKDETWYKILQHVNAAIKNMPENNKRAITKKNKYMATSVHLDNVRRVWRNDVMHPKEKYTQEEAEDVLSAVRLFIKDLINVL